jgi:integrase/recombinase XerD
VRVHELINRENYIDALDYLDYQDRIEQCCQDTLKRKWAYMRHFLEYACGNSFIDLENLNLTFPNYLESARNDNISSHLSPVTIRRTLLEIRDFFRWAMLYKRKKYKKVSPTWLNTLRISKSRLNRAGLPDREYFSLEDTLKLCDFEPKTLIDKRDRAAIALLFLSAIRISAMTSLKLISIDLSSMTVYQNPSEGVKTKNNKSMETVLLPIDELLEIATDWYKTVMNELGENSYWYPALSTDGLRFVKVEETGDVESRNQSLRHGVKRLCKRAGIKYRSPHKFRRGHGVYAVKNSENFEQFQAYSQNMGHEDPGTTFKYYSKLSNTDIRDVILKKK